MGDIGKAKVSQSIDEECSEPSFEGPKAMAGYAGVDNGYARFNHVRIPRRHMLSKFAQVTREGTYVKPPHDKVSYGGVSVSLSSEKL